MKRTGFILLFTFALIGVKGQSSFTLSGYINDKNSGENLIGVSIYIPELQKGTISNKYGFYSLSVPSGNYEVSISYIGYNTIRKQMFIDKNITWNIELETESIELTEVVVRAGNDAKRIQTTQLGTEILPMKSIKALPTIAGETDILKVIQLMPGIQAQSDGSSGFNVRGGNYDQNLVIFDEAVVYNPGHVFGIFSVFNDDAIKSVTVNKGDMPANYGGRISSVVDVVGKEGNNKKFEAHGGIGLLSSKLTLEGPIVKDKGSFIVSGRRTYIDLIAKLAESSSDESMPILYFYDVNAKANYKLSDKDRLYFSLYNGKDQVKLTAEDDRFGWDMPWGNFTSTLRWNHLFNDRLFMNTSLIHNSFFRNFTETQEENIEVKESEIRDQSLKLDFYYSTKLNHKIKFGGQATYHTITNNDAININNDRYAIEVSANVLDEFKVGTRLTFNFGVRYSLLSNIGPYDEYIKVENNENSILVKSYDKYELINNYHNLEPRFAAKYSLNEYASLKASYSQNSQYFHLVSTTGATLPFDTWIPSSKTIQPQKSTQYAMGYFQNLKNSNYQLAVECFYKEMDNQLELSEQFVPDFSSTSEADYVFGEGTAKGLEVSVKKLEGKLQGWIGYTVSDSKRQFDDLNEGKEFYASNDVRHDLSMSGTYLLNDKWSFGFTFIYRTGKPFTIPESRYFANGEVIDQYGEKNNYRLPAYNRMDVSATYRPNKKPEKRLKSELVFAIYNVYNRYNPTYIYFTDKGSVLENNFTTKAKSISLIPFLPSITWKFKF